MSPLLSLVLWPMAGRTPFSSLDGRMVSRNIPLQEDRQGEGVYLQRGQSLMLWFITFGVSFAAVTRKHGTVSA